MSSDQPPPPSPGPVPPAGDQPPAFAAYPPPPGYAMPGYLPPPAPAKKSRVALWIGLAVAGLLVLCCGAAGTGLYLAGKGVVDRAERVAPPSPLDRPEESSEPAVPEGTLGTPIREGSFEFVVQKVECGKASVDSKYLSEKPQGEFCLVSITVKNVGTQPQRFLDVNQKAISATGAGFAADSKAAYVASDGHPMSLTPVNPGNTMTGVMVYDVPKDTKITKMELHETTVSRGVTVKVD